MTAASPATLLTDLASRQTSPEASAMLNAAAAIEAAKPEAVA